MKNASILLIGALLFSGSQVCAQQQADSSLRRNTIKLDITSHWLYRNAVVIAYERTLAKRPYQSWGILAGIQQFPSVGNLSNANVIREKDAGGFKLGAEYRFYLQKENKYKAPRGVYVGPYTTFHSYTNSRLIEVDNDGVLEYADMESDLSIFNIGVQLGYQFVINNRWAIDLVFIGPSVSNYRFKTSLVGNYTFDPDEVTNDVVQGLIDQFPGFEELLDEGEFASNGRVNTWAYGYRYQFQVGYHFGRKK